MRLALIPVLLMAASALTACGQPAEPEAAPPVPTADAAPPPAPKGSDERRSQLREESAQRQIEAQMRDIQIEPAPAR